MSTPKFERLKATEVADWLSRHPGSLILDAREEAHRARGHLPGSVRLDGRNHEALLMREAKSRPVFIYCYHGNSSQTYAEMFSDFGFATVSDLIGGWDAWAQAPFTLNHWLLAEGFVDAHTPAAHGNTPLMHAAWHDIFDGLIAPSGEPHGPRLQDHDAQPGRPLWQRAKR